MIWKRWGSWKAHLYDSTDNPVCPYPQTNYKRGIVLGEKPGELVTLTGDALSAHGVPYGTVCNYCLKVHNKTRRGG